MLSLLSGLFQTEAWTTFILCTFGFFREMRPSESYTAEYLTLPPRNVTSVQLNKVFYPLGTYSYLTQLIVVFLVTDILRYKPIIIFAGVCGTAVIGLLMWSYSNIGLAFVQIFYGTYASAEVAYFTYMYAKVDKKRYERVTGLARAAILFGRFLAAITGQLLITYNVMNYRDLNYISLVSQVISVVLAVLLPSVGKSLYFYAAPEENENKNEKNTHTVEKNQQKTVKIKDSNVEENADKKIQEVSNKGFSFRYAANLMKEHLITAYTDRTVVCWSVWWALATAGYLLVFLYAQILWKSIVTVSVYNGGVEGLQTLCSAVGAYIAGFVNSDQTQKRGFLILTICSLVEGCLLVWSGITRNIWIVYAIYVIFACIYNFVLTIANAIVAKRLPEESFALIFGINTLLALLVQTVMTVILISDQGFALSPSDQYMAFGFYFIAVAMPFAITGFASYARSLRNKMYSVNC